MSMLVSSMRDVVTLLRLTPLGTAAVIAADHSRFASSRVGQIGCDTLEYATRKDKYGTK